MVGTASFSHLSDDIVLNIFLKLESDPRNWACLACVCTRFSVLVRNICCKAKCSQSIASVVSDLLSARPPALHDATSNDPPGGWAALHKLSVCCPGLLHAGILLENSDFGLERELGPDESYRCRIRTRVSPEPSSSAAAPGALAPAPAASDCSWSLLDDLYFDTVYDASESQVTDSVVDEENKGKVGTQIGRKFGRKRKKHFSVPIGAHLASGVWNLSREQGNKLLASRFRGDCLYICDWPGCVHAQEKRNYMLFRGIFKNFKRSGVWRTINDGNRSKTDLDCAFCSCKETWDLHSAFCLRRVFGYHDDGEPVVRAYVCENGHVSGAWTERPLYT